jgi:hypothetical protein
MQADDIDAALAEIDRVLTEAGFATIDNPLTVGGVPFDVIRAYVAGPGFLDLIVVIDSTGGMPSQLRQNFWLVERIARALDQAGSRRPLTAVLLHDADAARVPTEEFLRLARVLLVADINTVASELAPILPIVLKPTTQLGRDPLEDLLVFYGSGRYSDKASRLIELARGGARAVESGFAEWLDEAFVGSGGDDGES